MVIPILSRFLKKDVSQEPDLSEQGSDALNTDEVNDSINGINNQVDQLRQSIDAWNRKYQSGQRSHNSSIGLNMDLRSAVDLKYSIDAFSSIPNQVNEVSESFQLQLNHQREILEEYIAKLISGPESQAERVIVRTDYAQNESSNIRQKVNKDFLDVKDSYLGFRSKMIGADDILNFGSLEDFSLNNELLSQELMIITRSIKGLTSLVRVSSLDESSQLYFSTEIEALHTQIRKDQQKIKASSFFVQEKRDIDSASSQIKSIRAELDSCRESVIDIRNEITLSSEDISYPDLITKVSHTISDQSDLKNRIQDLSRGLKDHQINHALKSQLYELIKYLEKAAEEDMERSISLSAELFTANEYRQKESQIKSAHLTQNLLKKEEEKASAQVNMWENVLLNTEFTNYEKLLNDIANLNLLINDCIRRCEELGVEGESMGGQYGHHFIQVSKELIEGFKKTGLMNDILKERTTKESLLLNMKIKLFNNIISRDELLGDLDDTEHIITLTKDKRINASLLIGGLDSQKKGLETIMASSSSCIVEIDLIKEEVGQSAHFLQKELTVFMESLREMHKKLDDLYVQLQINTFNRKKRTESAAGSFNNELRTSICDPRLSEQVQMIRANPDCANTFYPTWEEASDQVDVCKIFTGSQISIGENVTHMLRNNGFESFGLLKSVEGEQLIQDSIKKMYKNVDSEDIPPNTFLLIDLDNVKKELSENCDLLPNFNGNLDLFFERYSFYRNKLDQFSYGSSQLVRGEIRKDIQSIQEIIVRIKKCFSKMLKTNDILEDFKPYLVRYHNSLNNNFGDLLRSYGKASVQIDKLAYSTYMHNVEETAEIDVKSVIVPRVDDKPDYQEDEYLYRQATENLDEQREADPIIEKKKRIFSSLFRR